MALSIPVDMRLNANISDLIRLRLCVNVFALPLVIEYPSALSKMLYA